jgi:hypothetical protein
MNQGRGERTEPIFDPQKNRIYRLTGTKAISINLLRRGREKENGRRDRRHAWKFFLSEE